MSRKGLQSGRVRPFVPLTLSEATNERLASLATALRVGKGRIVDACLTHATRCRCEICHAVRSVRDDD